MAHNSFEESSGPAMLVFSTKPYGEDFLYAKGCACALCKRIREEIAEKGMIPSGGWCDPRRHYVESEEEFLKRVPDGFLKWPKEHR